jgi:DNA helicase-2/ATP-dependent DNA helicase PcrA
MVDGRRAPLTPAASLGLSLHRALESFHREKAPEPEFLADCYEKKFLSAGYPDATIREHWRAKGRRILKGYLDNERENRSTVVSVEREFVYPLDRHEVRGMIDRIDRRPDGLLELVDYKTASGAVMEPADLLQLRFYGLGCKRSLALDPAWLTDFFIADARKETVAYDPAGEGELERRIIETAERIERGDFSPRRSFCGRCDLREACPQRA